MLRGEKQLFLRREDEKKAARKRQRKSNVAVENAAIWDALRECRLKLAKENDVPPFTIFHDATLMEMMELLPQSKEALLGISGVGEKKLERYGDAFLQVIDQFSSEAMA